MSEKENSPQARSRGRLLRVLRWAIVTPLTLWSVGAILLGGGPPEGPNLARLILAALFVIVGLRAVWRLKPLMAQAALVVGFLVTAIWFSSIAASNDRDWAEDQSRLPRAEIDGPLVTLHDIRSFRYSSGNDHVPDWYDETFDTRELEGSDFFLVHFSKDFKGVGHAMTTFRFKGDRFVTFSVEIRKEAGEEYGLINGIYKHYELMYVVADELDVVQLRTNLRMNDVYLYPSSLPREQLVQYFLGICERLNELHEEPTYYNTVTSNCATNLIVHWEKATQRTFPYDYRVLLPGYIDEIGLELGMFGHKHDIEEVRHEHFISDIARAAGDSEDFSLQIRR
jgi:hypothetical protein